MPDRRRRTDLLLPRERQSTDDNNPFAPPPEGRPDQPWQPRHPANDGNSDDPSSGSSDPSGDQGERPTWGSQWSSRQPGRSSGGGFGGRPGGQNGENGQNGGGGRQGQDGGSPGGLKWDPTDPAQRRARYALLSGMWAFFFALFDLPEIALLLGALALYWSISSLRAKPQRRPVDPTSPPPPPTPPTPPNKPQLTAAVSGLVMASIALVIVAASFTAQLVYRDYYTCVNDALTKSGQLACNDLLPDPLRGVIGVKE
ncbi:hypothetical protein OH805_14005 [Streptomyces sp. NBC_00879]|uniref:hypothetical protein n=1 Tax=unclassified Streptomyces TaxID=2593676 RepID=UPI003869F0DB|nr:hypothetical protein OHA61_14395 [Streptomyces sp. NBC_00885]WSY75161.1 hypothetical protein OH805_14005 [Streptomyces sp. NBC_00879]